MFLILHCLLIWPLARGGWRKISQTFTADPSTNAMNYVKCTILMAAAIAFKRYFKFVYSMASVVIMAGGTVLNAVAFNGGNYLACFLCGNDPKAALEETKKKQQSSQGLPNSLCRI